MQDQVILSWNVPLKFRLYQQLSDLAALWRRWRRSGRTILMISALALLALWLAASWGMPAPQRLSLLGWTFIAGAAAFVWVPCMALLTVLRVITGTQRIKVTSDGIESIVRPLGLIGRASSILATSGSGSMFWFFLSFRRVVLWGDVTSYRIEPSSRFPELCVLEVSAKSHAGDQPLCLAFSPRKTKAAHVEEYVRRMVPLEGNAQS